MIISEIGWIFIILAVVIIIIIETYKWLKDWWNFGTTNWHDQWKHRQTMNYIFGMRDFLFITEEYKKNYKDKRVHARILMLKAMHIAGNRRIHSKEFRTKFEEIIDYANTHDLYRWVWMYEKPSRDDKGLYQRYGHMR